MNKTIAFFDFDGTITRKDTMLELIRFAKGTAAYYLGLMRLSPWLIAMKAGIITNESAKEKMLSLFFRGMPEKDFDKICSDFNKQKLPSLIRPDAMKAITDHQLQQHEVVVVTASAENWVGRWCKENNIAVLATHLETDSQNRITGKLESVNCNGAEKVNRIKLVYDPADYLNIYCYGDSPGDKEMLQLATHPFYRHFKG